MNPPNSNFTYEMIYQFQDLKWPSEVFLRSDLTLGILKKLHTVGFNFNRQNYSHYVSQNKNINLDWLKELPYFEWEWYNIGKVLKNNKVFPNMIISNKVYNPNPYLYV